MTEILKIIYALTIWISLILVVTSHSLLPCVTNEDCKDDICLYPLKPFCYLDTCHCAPPAGYNPCEKGCCITC
ncbi:unnamed protein product [Lathyrus oleraceus]